MSADQPGAGPAPPDWGRTPVSPAQPPAPGGPVHLLPPPHRGGRADPYEVAECRPGRLVLAASSGVVWAGLAVTAVATPCFGSCAAYDWRHRVGSYNPVAGHGSSALSGMFVSAFLLAWFVYLLGRRLTFDGPTRTVRRTWLWLFHREIAAARLRCVRLSIASRTRAVTPAPGGAAGSPPAAGPAGETAGGAAGTDRCILTLAEGHGHLERDLKDVLTVSLCDLDAKAWPQVAPVALEIARLLQLPLVTEGEPKYADAAARAVLTQLRAASRGLPAGP